MEHLEEGVASPFQRVPYLVEDQYDRIGFHTFPDRAGWHLGHNGRWEPSRRLPSNTSTRPCQSIAGFLQAWLFFGLLDETLGPHAQLIPEDFYFQDGHGSWWITTIHLPRYLHAWKAHIIGSGSKSHGQLIKAQMALDKAHSLVLKYCSVTETNENQLWDLDPMITLSFLVLGETLSHAKSVITDLAEHRIAGWLNTSHRGWGYSKAVLQQMKHENWCPRSLHFLRGILQNSSIGLLYAMRVSNPTALELDHRNCNPGKCRAREVASYTKRGHCKEERCSCRPVSLDVSELLRCIRDGKLAVLQFLPAVPQLKIVEFQENLRFVILSHVWTDGFCKPEANTIPSCRLQNLVRIFERVSRAEQALHAGSRLNQLQTPIYFWIDTLAIPIGNKYQDERRKAIQMMHQMYTLATYTIVLDAGLMTQVRGASYAETAMKITTSYWITRLWTLQEAYLSRKILFNFADALVDMDTLETMRKTELVSPVTIAAQSYYSAILGPERHRKQREYESLVTNRRNDPSLSFLTSLWNALQWRTTSLAQHETLAIATLLGIDTKCFDDAMISTISDFQRSEARLDQKMQMLLSMIADVSDHAIPVGLIFFRGPKLSGRGFRWAPRSWLYDMNHTVPRLLSSQQLGGQLTPDGLLFRSPGFRLHSIGAEHVTVDNMDEIIFPENSSLGTWYVVRDIEESHSFPTALCPQSFAIIMQEPQPGSGLRIALMVVIVRTIQSLIYTQTLRRVWISTETDSGRIGTFRQGFQNQSSGAIFGEALNADQQWCLDGLEQSQTPTRQETSWPLSSYSSWLSALQVRFLRTEK